MGSQDVDMVVYDGCKLWPHTESSCGLVSFANSVTDLVIISEKEQAEPFHVS